MKTKLENNTLGEKLQHIRRTSGYKDRPAYAQQAELSKEGLRKIEIGERLPTAETLATLLKVGKISGSRYTELMKLRDELQAERDGTNATPPRMLEDEFINQFTIRLATLVDAFLADCTDDDGEAFSMDAQTKKDLTSRIRAAVKEQLSVG